MSTLRVDNLNARTGTTIAVPTGTTLYSPGHVIQVVSVDSLTPVAISSSSYTSIGSVSITPKFANSKILVMASTYVHRNATGNAGYYWDCYIYRSDVSTRICGMADAVLYQSYGDGARETLTAFYKDSPATTSSVTYGMCASRISGSSTAQFNVAYVGTMVLMEIGA